MTSAMIFQEPMTSFSPVHTIGDQITEAILLHVEGTSQAEARRQAVALLTPRWHSECREPGRYLALSAERRHAATGDDRHGAGLQTRNC